MDLEVFFEDELDITHYEIDGDRGFFEPFAIDHDEQQMFFVKVSLWDRKLDEEGVEFAFCILRKDRILDNEVEFYSGLDTNGWFDERTKELIKLKAYGLIVKLVEKYQPDLIYRVTSDRSPPEAALDKHYFIGHFFRYLGYEVRETDPYEERRVWIMRKVAI